jgi:ATP-dependent exoDNAse (exonuclease V) beta subunit
MVESGIIDALYLSDGAWSLVEFKTDRVKDEADLRDLLRRTDYLAQSQRYAVACERLLGRQPRVLLCLLDYRGRVRVEANLVPDARPACRERTNPP